MPRLILACVFLVGVIGECALAQNNTGEQLDSLIVDGVKRQWRMYVPPSYKKGTAMPLVLDFHGTGSAPYREAALSEFEKLAAEKGFLVASPAATYHRKGDGKVTWNVDLQQEGVNDVQFIRLLISHLSKQFSVNPAKIYAAGMSGGARMSSRLACDLSDVIAAIGPVAGVRYPEDCKPTRPVPVITFHGKRDGINHYEHQPDSPPHWRMGVEQAISGWVKNNQCVNSPTAERITTAVTRLSFSGCKDGADVVLYRSEDAGHTWPGSPLTNLLKKMELGKSNTDVPATRLIWEFFEAYSL